MLHDIRGLPLSSSSPDAVATFDRTILSYLRYRVDTPEHLARALAADPEVGLAYCVKGYFAMLSYKQAHVPPARRVGYAEAARRAPQ